MMDDRGQVSPNPPMVLYIGLIAVVVMSVLIIGIDVASEFADGIADGIDVNESAYEQAAEDTTTPHSSPFQLVPFVVVVMIGVVIVGVVRMAGQSTVPTQPEQPDRVTMIKEQYVDGEIRTTTKLEAELENHVEPYLDDSDVQELDDLLDNGDNE